MSKRIGPEAKIIALFTALPDDSKRIVFDVIKTQTATPRKASTKKPKKDAQPDLPTGKPLLCGVCGNTEDFQDHFEPSPNYHPFASSVTVAAKRSSRKGVVTNFTANIEGEPESATAVGVSGD